MLILYSIIFIYANNYEKILTKFFYLVKCYQMIQKIKQFKKSNYFKSFHFKMEIV